MAHKPELRAKARDYYEIQNQTLEEINKVLGIPVSTLSLWKIDKDQPHGPWEKGRLKETIDKTAREMNNEIIESSAFKKLEDNIRRELRIEMINSTGKLLASEDELSKTARQRATSITLNAMSIDYLDNKAHMGLEVADQILIEIKKNPSIAKMSEVKAYVDIVKTVKEMRHGKSPDTIVLNNINGEVTQADIGRMSTKEIQQRLAKKREEAIEVEAKVIAEG